MTEQGTTMRGLLTAIVGRLEELGLDVAVDRSEAVTGDGADVNIDVSRGRSRQAFSLTLVEHPTFSTLDTAWRTPPGVPVLIGAELVSARTADALRRAGLPYVDAAGNASIRFGDVLIDVRGRRSEQKVTERPKPRTGNLFSTARARVAFVLLQWPRMWKESQRILARSAGVSLGQANDALTIFRQNGFGPGGHRSDSALLDVWAASFPSGLAHKLLLATYQGVIEDLWAQAPTALPAGAVVSGELVAPDALRPAAATIYVPELDPMLPVQNRWRADGEPNIVVRRTFWTAPPGETGDRAAPGGLPIAPSVLVYADLLASEDPRVRSLAPKWRNGDLR